MKKLFCLFSLLMLLFISVSCNEEKEETVGLAFDKGEISVYVGDSVNVKPNVTGVDNATNYILEYALSSNIATIDNNGNLTAINAGNLVVTVTIKDVEKVEVKINVKILENENVEYTVNLDVNGGTDLEVSSMIFKDGSDVVLPTPEKEGYIFAGWYEDEVLVQSLENKNYNLVAKWAEAGSLVTANYVIGDDVYLSNYTTRSELINDLISDIQYIKGKKHTLEFFQSHTAQGYGIFIGLRKSGTFFSDDEMMSKWGWLLEYAKKMRNAAGLDTSYYDDAITKGCVSDGVATINIEMIGFICGKEYSYSDGKETIKSSDYSKLEVSNGFWDEMTEYRLQNSSFEISSTASDVLVKALKVGAVFEGWYTSSDFASSSKVTDDTKITYNMTLYPKFETPGSTSNVTFNYNGGASEALYIKYGTKVSSLTINSYNGTYWNGTDYTKNIYICTGSKDPKAQHSTRIYVDQDDVTGLYKVVSVLESGAESSWPKEAEYVISISNQYNGTNDDKFDVSKIAAGTVLIFDKAIKKITSSSPANVTFYGDTLDKDNVVEKVDSNFVMPIPNKVGYSFEGWYDDFNNKYESAADFEGLQKITLYATWLFQDKLIGSFIDKSWVAPGDYIQLAATYMSGDAGTMTWVSDSPNVATVDENGLVRGVSEGLAEIIVKDSENEGINFTFYVTVLPSNLSGIEKLIVDSNNASLFTVDNLIVGIEGVSGTYYTDVVGSVSKLLFEDYVVYDDYYLSSPNNTTNLSSNGVEFITFHYAADMVGSVTSGGKNLASYNRSCNNGAAQASWHYSTGNDGIWACQTEAYGAWHAGSSKAMTWDATGITYKSTDPEFPKITLGSDNYFYLNGQKTKVQNTTAGTRLNIMGLPFKIVNNEYYIGGHYLNETYNYISSKGGNNNSIGIESSCAKGSDLWLTWQYSAQLCAKLLLKYNLPLTKLVGHHFFSGKWCPQPMLEYDLLIWWEFVELVRQEMDYFKNYSNYELEFATDSSYVSSNGRVASLPTYSECVTYTVTYKVGSTTKSITLSSILPGTIA